MIIYDVIRFDSFTNVRIKIDIILIEMKRFGCGQLSMIKEGTQDGPGSALASGCH